MNHSLNGRTFILIFAAGFICAAQTFSIQQVSPIPSVAPGSTTGITVGNVSSTPAGLSFTLNNFDPNAWLLGSNGFCAPQTESQILSTPVPVTACIGTNMPRGLHQLFYDIVYGAQAIYFALPLDVTGGSLTLNTPTVNLAHSTLTGQISVTATSPATIHSATVSNAQAGVGSWLSVQNSCADDTTCRATITATPSQLLSPKPGYTYIGKVTFTASDGSVAEALVNYTYEPSSETPITITSPSSFTGLVDEEFSATLSASGGTSPYTWSGTDLPAGVTLSSGGVLSGTVTSANTYAIPVTVTDSMGESQTATETLVIQNASTAIPTQIFPHMAADSTWQTNFLILNTGSSPMSFTLKFHPNSGTTVAVSGLGAVSKISGTVPARGSVSVLTDTTVDSDGWAELDSPSGLSGVAVMQEAGSQASVMMSAPGTKFTIPFDATTIGSTSGYVDGLAIANADPAHDARITCQAYSTSGSAVGGTLTGPTIAASGHIAFLLQSTPPFSSLPATGGQLACAASTSVGVIELRALGNEVSTLPALIGQ